MPKSQLLSTVRLCLIFIGRWLIHVQFILFEGNCEGSRRSRFRPRLGGLASESNSFSDSGNVNILLQIKNVPLEFSHFGNTYDLQGAVCYRPPSHGFSGEGHYTTVCLRDGRLVLLTDTTVSLDPDKIKFWLQRCRVLVYASSLISTLLENSLTSMNRAQHNCGQWGPDILATCIFELRKFWESRFVLILPPKKLVCVFFYFWFGTRV